MLTNQHLYMKKIEMLTTVTLMTFQLCDFNQTRPICGGVLAADFDSLHAGFDSDTVSSLLKLCLNKQLFPNSGLHVCPLKSQF